MRGELSLVEQILFYLFGIVIFGGTPLAIVLIVKAVVTELLRPNRAGPARRMRLDAGLVVQQLVDDGHAQSLTQFYDFGLDANYLLSVDPTAYFALENAGLLPAGQDVENAIQTYAY